MLPGPYVWPALLKQALAAHHECAPETITLGNGSNEVLELIARVFAGPGDEVMFAEHCFVVYPLVTKAIGATPVQIPARDYGHDLEAMASALTPNTRLVFIANPNNPTGTWVNDTALKTFMRVVPADCLVVLREAGVDLGVANNIGITPAHYAEEYGHAECLVVLRSMAVVGKPGNSRIITPKLRSTISRHFCKIT